MENNKDLTQTVESEDSGRKRRKKKIPVDKEILIAVGSRIKEARDHLKITQTDFAGRMDMSKAHLSAVELGRIKPGFNFLFKADKIFNISALYILKGMGSIFLDSPLMENQTIKMLERLFKLDEKEFREFIKNIYESSLVYHVVMEFYYSYVSQKRELIESEKSSRREALLAKEKENGDKSKSTGPTQSPAWGLLEK